MHSGGISLKILKHSWRRRSFWVHIFIITKKILHHVELLQEQEPKKESKVTRQCIRLQSASRTEHLKDVQTQSEWRAWFMQATYVPWGKTTTRRSARHPRPPWDIKVAPWRLRRGMAREAQGTGIAFRRKEYFAFLSLMLIQYEWT